MDAEQAPQLGQGQALPGGVEFTDGVSWNDCRERLIKVRPLTFVH